MRQTAIIAGLSGAAVALLLGACQDPPDEEFTPVPVRVNDRPPPQGPVGDGAPPPPTDAGIADAGPDGITDGGAGDGAPADGAMDAMADGVVDAEPDVAVDTGPAEPACFGDQDCVLAVRLPTCDPCPVAAHVEEVLADRCLVVFVQGAPISAYAPADCWAECGEAVGEACFDAPVAPVCEPRGGPGQCLLFE